MTNINIRIDDTLKKQSESVFDAIGLNMTTAITAFLKQAVRLNGMPFELRADPYELYVRRALAEASEEAKNPGPRMTHEEFIKEMRDYAKELSAGSNAAV